MFEEHAEKIFVADKETGTFITEVETVDEGFDKIKEFEEMDKAEGNYTPDFYDIVDEEHVSINAEINPLKYARKYARMTQQELADKSGVNLRSIQNYEQGFKDLNNAKAVTVLRLARALNCDITDLIILHD